MRSKMLDLKRYDTDKIDNEYLAGYDPIFSPLYDREIKLLELGIRRGGSLLLWRDYFPHGTIAGIDINPVPGWREESRIQVFQGRQEDTAMLSRVARQVAPEGFDIIIDDASHLGNLTRISFWHLFEHHLKPGGIYVIEDWGSGYWGDWPDGRTYQTPAGSPPGPGFEVCREVANPSGAPTTLRNRLGLLRRKLRSTVKSLLPGGDLANHSAGMVGFIKELIDEQGAGDLTRGTVHGTAARPSRFQSVLVLPSVVFVTKR